MTKKYRIVEVVDGIGSRVYHAQKKELWYWVDIALGGSDFKPWNFSSYREAEKWIKEHYGEKKETYHEVNI